MNHEHKYINVFERTFYPLYSSDVFNKKHKGIKLYHYAIAHIAEAIFCNLTF